LAKNSDIDDLNYEFAGTEIKTTWLKEKPYVIQKIRLDLSPATHKFVHEGKEVTMTKYFKMRYDLTLDPKQPLV
jgi:hypothetical protein